MNKIFICGYLYLYLVNMHCKAHKMKNNFANQQIGITIDEQPRRGQRLRTAPRQDFYIYGIIDCHEIDGLDHSEEDYGRKRHRKNHRRDDSSEFSDNERYPRKKQHLFKKVETLLEWKTKLADQVSIFENRTTSHSVKKISGQNLEKYGKDMEGIFINIMWGAKGQNLEDFQKIKIDSNILMSKGLVFIWAHKQIMSSLLRVMDKKGFFYVQNFEIVNLDRNKAIEEISERDKTKKTVAEETSQNGEKIQKSYKEQSEDLIIINKLGDTEPKSLIMEESSEYFNQSKKTLLIFRKVSNQKIELRHQRTCDVVFNLTESGRNKCSGDIKKYVMKMIETMLPRGVELTGKNEPLKLMELWAEPNVLRKGWIHISEK